MVRSLTDDGTTVLLTTLYLEEADALADEMSVFDHGTVIAHGTPAELKQMVGAQTLVVRSTGPKHLDDVRALLGRIARHAVDSPARGVLSIPVDSDAVLAR